jgi:hypothetical protein
MVRLGCLFWNQRHHESPRTPSLNGVGLVWVIFATFNLSYCKVTLSPHSCIVKVHVITTASSCSDSTLASPIFLDIVLLFRWLDREVRSIHQWRLAFRNEWVPHSTTSIAFSKDWFVYVPLLGAWEFCFTSDLWCSDDAGWLDFY